MAVRWYLRYALSYRDVEELLAERGIEVDHVAIYRWVQRFTPLLSNHGSRPTEVSTDRAPAYPRVIEELFPAACHVTEQYANNLVKPIMGV